MKLVRLEKTNGSWDKFSQNWDTQCQSFGEELGEFAPASFSTLDDECGNDPSNLSTGVYGLVDEEGMYHAGCFLNSADLKGHIGKVLRVRHMILSPFYDFENLPIDEYATVFAHAFSNIVDISNNELPSKHIKIHYRSPYDRTFFASYGLALKSSKTFSSVESRGMWLHLSKT